MRNCKAIIFIVILFAACKKPYNPPAITGNAGYLVIEGVINSGSDPTTIKLSKTVNVSSAVTANPVLNAVVAVVSDQNVTFPLTEAGNGNYVSPGLNLDNSHTYRLSIKTPDNKQYQSDLVPVVVSPPIDSVGFNIVNTAAQTGLQIYANTHDASNSAKYFRWDYEEAWAFHAKYISYWVSNGTTIVIRSPAQDITVCYANDISSTVVLGSSAKLQQDIIYQNPITFIPSTSEKVGNEYSILLRQYALTADAYNFWIALKKNTEQLGSIFDAQPTQLVGNLHCITNPSEPVIGYLSVCKVASKRLVISNIKLPAWAPVYPYSCEEDTVKGDAIINTLVRDSANFIPTGPAPMGGQTSSSFYLYSSRVCVDCTVRGSRTEPAFFK